MRPFIVVGDKTDHGGEVVEGDLTTTTHGKAIARVGDKVTCPKHGHGPTTIVSGDLTMILDGKPVARHGDVCACGAKLISSQVVSYSSEGGGAGGSASASALGGASSAASSSAAGSSGAASAGGSSTAPPPFDFDEQVELLTKTAFAEGLPYYIKAGSRTWSGRVGANLLLPRIDTAQEDSYQVWVGDEALAMMEGAA